MWSLVPWAWGAGMSVPDRPVAEASEAPGASVASVASGRQRSEMSQPVALQATAQANANIALVKYWGKADDELIIPNASSLSLTIDGLGTTTQVTFHADGAVQDGSARVDAESTSRPMPQEQGLCGDGHESSQDSDTLIIDGRQHSGKALHRVSDLLDRIRELSGLHAPATVISRNTVPYAAGLASSASAFAALAAAGSRAAGLNLDPKDLSRLARRGSGSASRSIYSGLAVWHAGHDDVSSYAEPVSTSMEDAAEGAVAEDFGMNLAMVVILISDRKKSLSSRVAMRRSVQTSPLYQAWIESCGRDLHQALAAIGHADVEALGVIAESNSYGMHATMMTAQPPVVYWQPATVEALHAVEELRAEGIGAWSTMDAGPNVKVLTASKDAVRVCESLRERLPELDIRVHEAGKGVRILDRNVDNSR